MLMHKSGLRAVITNPLHQPLKKPAPSTKILFRTFSTPVVRTRPQHMPIRFSESPRLNLKNQFRRVPQRPIRIDSPQHYGTTPMAHRAFVALGSNMGDRVAMIEQACKEMEASGKIKIKRTSSLWETKAMYVIDQDKFVNGACMVS